MDCAALLRTQILELDAAGERTFASHSIGDLLCFVRVPVGSDGTVRFQMQFKDQV